MALRARISGLLASSSKTSSFQSLQNIGQGNEKRCYFIRPRTYSTLSPSSREANLETAFFKPGLVIFDKDGTLVCFHAMWTPWCKGLASRMKQETERDLADTLYDVLGYDHAQDKVKIGALAENTHPQIRTKIEEMLVSMKFEPKHAKEVVDNTWRDTPENMDIKLTANLSVLFQRLKSEGIKIAICTSDSKEGTNEFLEKMKLEPYVDMIMCGDDPNGKPKPNPHNALYICEKMGVEPSQTIMVGDTPADTLMGQQAALGLTVGVLTGVGGLHDLNDADVIVGGVQECVDMILPENTKQIEKPPVYQVTTRGISKIAQRSLLHHNSYIFGDSSRGSSRAFSTSSRVSSEYSHIIVGAGSAGCVLANRLSEERQ